MPGNEQAEYGGKTSRIPLLIISGLASCFCSWFGLMAAAWGGTGLPSMTALLFWLLPALTLPVFVLYFFFPQIAARSMWFLLLVSYAAFFVGTYRDCLAGKCTTTNPFKIAVGCLYGSPTIPGLFIAAACMHLAETARKYSSADRI
jgi:hypothetical protein